MNSISDELTYDCLDYFYYVSLENVAIDKMLKDDLINKIYEIALIENSNEDEYRNKTRSITIIGNFLCGNIVQNQVNCDFN